MTLDKASLQAVIERLEKADWPDRGIDADIALATGLKSVWNPTLPHYTTSVDAAIALTERMLPGWARSVSKWYEGDSKCVLTECREVEDGLWWHSSHGLVIEADHKTEPLALLLALFKALLAKEEADD